MTRQQALDLQERISHEIWPDDVRERLRCLLPFMWNHCLTCEMLAAEGNDAKVIGDRCAMAFQMCRREHGEGQRRDESQAEGGGEGVRRTSKDKTFGVHAHQCPRSLEIWDSTAQIKLGRYHRDDEAWRLAAAAARTCSMRIPQQMEEGATPTGSVIHEVDEDGLKDEVDQEPDDAMTDDVAKQEGDLKRSIQEVENREPAKMAYVTPAASAASAAAPAPQSPSPLAQARQRHRRQPAPLDKRGGGCERAHLCDPRTTPSDAARTRDLNGDLARGVRLALRRVARCRRHSGWRRQRLDLEGGSQPLDDATDDGPRDTSAEEATECVPLRGRNPRDRTRWFPEGGARQGRRVLGELEVAMPRKGIQGQGLAIAGQRGSAMVTSC